MLPFKPEPINRLKHRYSKALERIWIAQEGMTEVPATIRTHVFDFETGLRLIVSRDVLYAEDGPKIHVSASYFKPWVSIEEFEANIFSSFMQLHGRPVMLKPIAVSPKGIPHFTVEEVN